MLVPSRLPILILYYINSINANEEEMFVGVSDMITFFVERIDNCNLTVSKGK